MRWHVFSFYCSNNSHKFITVSLATTMFQSCLSLKSLKVSASLQLLMAFLFLLSFLSTNRHQAWKLCRSCKTNLKIKPRKQRTRRMCFFTILQFDGGTSQFTSPFFVGHSVVERERDQHISAPQASHEWPPCYHIDWSCLNHCNTKPPTCC